MNININFDVARNYLTRKGYNADITSEENVLSIIFSELKKFGVTPDIPIPIPKLPSAKGKMVCQQYNCFTDDLEIGRAATSQQITQCSKNDGLNMTKEEALEILNSECSDIFKVQTALKIARDTLAETINKNQHLECGKEYSYPLANGTLHIDVSADNFHPGLDIEFTPDEFEGLAGTFPRILLEAPIDSETLEQKDLRACIWARADSEDYTQCIYFEEKQLGHSVYSSTKQEETESRAANKKEEEYEIGL